MRRRDWLLSFVVALALVVVVAGSFTLWFYRYAVSPGPGQSTEANRVYIPPRSGFDRIQAALVDAGVIADDFRFRLLARYMGVSRQLKAGEYLFPEGATPLDILHTLAAGETILRQFTIPEGSTLLQVADILAKEGWTERQDFLDLVQSPPFLKTLGIGQPSLEGYLFPETYHFPKGEDIRQIVGKMVAQTRRVIREECPEEGLRQFTFSCGGSYCPREVEVSPEELSEKRFLGMHEILTLASIVEKETGRAEERPLVAGVFLNRLASHMRLQADPTLVYGLQKFGLPLSRKDLKTPGPYNTYLNFGLPQGPICNPGRAAVAAVFHPNQQYYYFVAQGDGRHDFSTTLKEHNRAVQRYREVMRGREDGEDR